MGVVIEVTRWTGDLTAGDASMNRHGSDGWLIDGTLLPGGQEHQP